jgi:hypothetical protein
MQHLDEGTIHAWLDGALSADEAADAERHARECAACAALVADARGMIAGATRIVSALDEVPGGVIPKQSSVVARRSLWRTLHLTPFRAALAATILVVAGSFAVVRHAPRLDGSAKFERVAAPIVPSASAPAPTAAPPADKPASERRLRVRDEAPPGAPVAATSPSREEAKVAASNVEASRKATTDSLTSTRIAAAAAQSVAESRDKARADTVSKLTVIAPLAPSAAPRVASAVAGGVAEQPRRDAALRNAADVQSVPFSLVLTAMDDRPLAAGCFEIVPDSLRSSIPLPARFSLDSAADSTGRRVRALTPDGRRGGVIAGLTWEPAPRSDRFAIVRREGTNALALRQQPVGSFAPGRGAGSAGTRPVRVSRVDCR